MQGYLENEIQTPMAQGQSTRIISMIERIRTSRLSTKKSLSLGEGRHRDKGLRGLKSFFSEMCIRINKKLKIQGLIILCGLVTGLEQSNRAREEGQESRESWRGTPLPMSEIIYEG